ncbi:MAG TPA: hypothetical protein VFH06_03010 [Candidatus Saccharimonadales bacterium]|nr:hypothetical protein [Candidatus Saccharimonadales bacterium]
MRTVWVIRHAHSTANTTEVSASMTAEGLAFANRSAGLTERGTTECLALAALLPEKYGITPATTPVAVSEFTRTQLTAKSLGFEKRTPHPELNEVEHGMALDVLRGMLRQNRIPPVALAAAEKTLKRPPTENIWVTHGLLVAGLCTMLGTASQYERPVPRQCEVRQLTF